MLPSWVNDELAKVEEKAAAINEQWQPVEKETPSGDEVYSNDSPNWKRSKYAQQKLSRPTPQSGWNNIRQRESD
ncbi:MAG: hypothetical protein GY832_29775 [Chloroflexi bacterium]|nr:hypothetical protein [Chloroflexota bacterium]